MKPKRYLIPAEQTRTELRVVNSRFITTAGPAFSVEEAREFIQQIRDEFPDASHNVPAYLIGAGPTTIAHCSDDGEPSGTAGRPVLAVLQGSGLGDVVVAVTRYFGGTKLGTGGLVRAYSDSVKAVLEILPRAERVPTFTVMLETPYPLYERISLLIPKFKGQLINQEFAADITLTIRFPIEQLPQFEAAIQELSRNSISVIIIERNDNTILPVDADSEIKA